MPCVAVSARGGACATSPSGSGIRHESASARFKGRLFRDAETDGELRQWLGRLSQSSNRRNAAVGAWYLARLAEREPQEVALCPSETTALLGLGTRETHGDDADAHEPGIVIYTDPAVEELKRLVDAARSRLAELEARYMNDLARAEFIEWRIYVLLRGRYRRRDHVERLVEYRRRYLETLLQDGEEEAEHVASAHDVAQDELESDYESLWIGTPAAGRNRPPSRSRKSRRSGASS